MALYTFFLNMVAADAACEVLGISDTKGLSLMEKAQKCWTSLNGVVFHCAISSLLQISAP